MGIIQRTTRGASVLAKLQLYKSLVVPLLEYASPVWSPHTKKDTQKLELVQRHVTKAILGYQNMDYETKLRVLGSVSTSTHRKFTISILMLELAGAVTAVVVVMVVKAQWLLLTLDVMGWWY